jgi:hypothetical protein
MNTLYIIISLGIVLSYVYTVFYQTKLFTNIQIYQPALYESLGSPSALWVCTGISYKGADFIMRPHLYTNQDQFLSQTCQKIRLSTAVSIGLFLGLIALTIGSLLVK